MRASIDSKTRTLARWVLRIVVHAWPAESREWGRALEGELELAESGTGALLWALGGAMVFTKAMWKSFWSSWKRPVGIVPGSATEALLKRASPAPRTPRWATAALLAASLGILLLPEARQGIGEVCSSWRSNPWDRVLISDLRKIAGRAEKDGDARTLAFAALELRDPAERKERLRLADEAVALDPGLAWIYVNLSEGRVDAPIPEEWVQRLVRWDADNGAPHLLEAQRAAAELRNKWREAHPGEIYPQGQMDRKGHWDKIDRELAKDPQWLAAMDRAIAAPRFDSYVIRHSELYRDVMSRQKIDQPTVAMLGRAGTWFPSFGNAIAYIDVLIERGEQAEDAGNLDAAAKWYLRVAHFGERLHIQNQSEFETRFASHIQEKAYRKLQPVLEKMGRSSEAAMVAYNLAETQQLRLATTTKRNRAIWDGLPATAWPAVLVQLAAMSMVLLGSATILAVLLLFAIGGRIHAALRKLLCVTADLGPVLLFLSCGAFLLTYHPFAKAFEAYLGSAASHGTEIQESLLIISIPGMLFGRLFLQNILWWGVIFAGVPVIAWLLTRMVRPQPAGTST